jgi:hypothetical protein
VGQPAAAQQPGDPDQVDDACPQPVVDAVFRAAGLSRPVIDRRADHPAALAQHQRRHETVHVIEIGQPQEKAARQRLDAAAGIRRAVAQDRRTYAIGDTRGEPPHGRVTTLGPLSDGQHRHRRVRASADGDQVRQVGGIVLAVTVQRGDDLAARRQKPATDRRALAA